MLIRSLRVLGATLAGTILLSGCTGGGQQPPPSGGPPSAAPTAATPPATPTLVDRSDEVLAQPPTLTAVATTQAKPTSSFRGSTFTIYGLSRSDTATILTYTVTGGTEHASPSDALPRAWEKAPRLETPTHSYRVVTFQQESGEWAAVANPIYRIEPGKESGPLTVLYPPLPAGTGTVTLRGLWFEDVSVPVTDLG
ncbi:hypothetical protein G7070_01935 [Propioniciclava coleopterorum]|uniref:Lipoprotein n=1 Tax=Propioniciclava coleopterorum TaxID=2714937 RepID=A0A6G7Y364_9ACTN|nr:hypothetical protein [Propioniciclava coleopterorum]QIK71270.1 hypothetical protein G7070_01935 [Propioniciclava coleopterorum]